MMGSLPPISNTLALVHSLGGNDLPMVTRPVKVTRSTGKLVSSSSAISGRVARQHRQISGAARSYRMSQRKRQSTGVFSRA